MEAQIPNPVHSTRYPFLEAQGPGFNTWRLLKDKDQEDIYYDYGMLSEGEFNVLIDKYKGKRYRKSIMPYIPGHIDKWAYNPNDPYHREIRGQLPIDHIYDNIIEDPGMRIMEIHNRYLYDVTSKKIILHHSDKGYVAFDYVVRGTARYENRQKAKCVNIVKKWKEQVKCPGTTVRISPRHKGSRTRLYELFNEYKPKFLNYIRNYKYKEKGLDGKPKKDPNGKSIYKYPFRGVKYLWSIEPTEKHYIHLHVVFGMLVDNGNFAYICLKWWQNQGFDIEDPGVKVESVRSEGKLIGYIQKYVMKTCKDKFWNSLLWITGKRSWGSSSGLAQPLMGLVRLTQNDLEEDPIEKWVYIGVMDDIMVDYVLKENPPPEQLRLEYWFMKNLHKFPGGWVNGRY